MRIPWRAAAGAVLITTTLVPAASAPATGPTDPAWQCSYYKYDHGTQRWVRDAFLVDKEWYESQPGHQQYQSWDCRYCFVSTAIVLNPEDNAAAVVARASETASEVVPPIGHAASQALATQPDGSVGGTVDDILAALPSPVDQVVDAVRAAIDPILPPRPCPLLPPEEVPPALPWAASS